jgi:N-methylhydantoinase A
MARSAAPEANWRIAVDVGGTFTDLALVDGAGLVHVHKVPTTPTDPSQGVLAAVAAAATAQQLQVGELLARVGLFVHGSTIATNTVLEGKGARVGLITTEGFRDALEIRRGWRENPWDHRTPYAPVLVPRYLRLPVRGRLNRDGREIAPLVEADVTRATEVFRKEGVDAVAVCLFNSYLDPAHEARVARRVANELPAAAVTQSHKVAAIIGEYERSSTAVLNAYIGPRTLSYLKALSCRLVAGGLRGPLLLIQNNGGAVSVDEVAERPVALLLSGPAAGIGALKYYAESIGSGDLISMEIGGTSCDVMLTREGSVAYADRVTIGGYLCIAPSVEIHTIGAGGGTIANVDSAGLIHVGPAGAGADPGPACYGLGGEEATVTDAQLVLGRVRPGPIAGGSITLDAHKARQAIAHRIARPLGLTVEAAAAGIIRLMEQKLLHALQRLSSERGHDPKRFTLVAAGGAGPLHGASVGRALGVRRVYMPKLAGAFCALGMLNSDVRHDYMRVHFDDLEGADGEGIQRILSELLAVARAGLAREGFARTDMACTCSVDLRYAGQQWDLTVPVEAAFDPARVRRAFEAEHDRLFGHIQPGGTIEITKLRVAGVGRLPPLPQARRACPQRSLSTSARRRIWLSAELGWGEVPVYEPAALTPGGHVDGPAVIDEATTTVLIGAGDRLAVDPTGGYLVALAGDDA